MYEREDRVHVPDGDVQIFDYDTEHDKALELVQSIELKGYILDRKDQFDAAVDEQSNLTSDYQFAAYDYYFVRKP